MFPCSDQSSCISALGSKLREVMTSQNSLGQPCLTPLPTPLSAPTLVAASILKHLTSSFEITITATARVFCISIYIPFMNPRHSKDAAHGGIGTKRGEECLSAGWAVLLIKDDDKPGFIVHSCSLVTAYDEYLQKERGGEGG